MTRQPLTFKAVLRRFLVSSFNSVQASGFLPIPTRTLLLRLAGMQMGKDCCIFENSNFNYPKGMTLGNGVFINANCAFDDCDKINIESNVFIGPGVRVITGSHLIGSERCRAGKHTEAQVNIKVGSWIGAHVIIMPGVTVESSCVIAAGSVVTKNTKPSGLYAGIPARRIRTLSKDGKYV
jgi:acetyltransferase-like isoleucine patch superfamily enzyme